MDFNVVNVAAEGYREDIVKFLGDLIKTPGESAEESNKIARVKAEVGKLGLDKIDTDPQGNLLGYMGSGEKSIALDEHIDTVGIGEMSNWKFDLYDGYETETEIGGRGTSDQEDGIVSAIYGAKIMKDLGLLSEKYTALVTVTIQEEDCDGLRWQYVIKEDGIRLESAVSTEPADGGTYRGQRGRMEVKVDIKGVLCRGSVPERGDNAVYKMADILRDVRTPNNNGDIESTAIRGLVRMLDPKYNLGWQEARFLGRGTVTVSQILHSSPSWCAVTDGCTVPPDRRMIAGETWESCLEEIRNLPAVKKYGDDVMTSVYNCDRPSYIDLTYETEYYLPMRVTPENHDITKALMEAHKDLYGETRKGSVEILEMREKRPLLDKWTFSTNSVSITGHDGIPCIGFGPGAEAQVHAPDEKIRKDDLVHCAAVYAALPAVHCG